MAIGLIRRRATAAHAAGDELKTSTGISLAGVTKRFGETSVIDDLYLEVAGGELLVLLGPSGSGKTTTLNLIAGLEEPDSGAVYFGDSEVTRVPPEDRDIAMVFQNYSLYPHLGVRQNITFPLRIRRVPSAIIAERLKSATEMLAIDHLLKRRINELSGGQRQRVAIAKALIKRPEAFLLDEPFSALDAVVRRQLRTELVRLHAELETTTIFVTHDQDEAMAIADRIAVMREGHIVQIAAPLDVYTDPVDLWVAEFIGEHPINVLPVLVEGRQVRLFDAAHGGLKVSSGVAERLARAGQHTGEIVVGLRPELVQIAREGADGAGRGRVSSRQLHGTEILYEIEVDKGTLRAAVASMPGVDVFSVGDTVSFDFRWAGAFAFARDSGARIRIEFDPRDAQATNR
jgi:multiple sugar transport system ATP-binding protein